MIPLFPAPAPVCRRPATVSSLFLRLFTCLFVALALAGCSKERDPGAGQKKRAAIPVTVADSVKKTLPLELAATGHVEASSTVDIRSQVTGTLKTVHFREGDSVKAGALLFSIDPRPFAANLAKAEADLAKDRASLENARRESGRYSQAAQKGYVSQEQADQAATQVATLVATVKADEAAVDSARLELEYCSIRAPFTGRTGELLIHQGNLITENAATPMITLKQVAPILTSFTVPGQHLQDIARYQAAGSLKVLATLQKQADSPALTGQLAFIDNTVDPTTGMLRLKASFTNEDGRLWPGQLIEVRLELTKRPDCIVVPSQAVQVGQQGSYVYVVKDDQTVGYRPVTAGMLYQGETVIESGLAAGERVVTDGQLQLADGVKIEVRGVNKEGGGQQSSGNKDGRTAS
ncbi:efflux RND transporter periplasmic adaptor subunit [Desulfobulbus sp.]|uniref:efflux RND transporter periplasmic adaptor subunit n=1 Tax=Desulfobulbus sp. TaxID=895 RepID=UPI00286FA8CF|nr:efflux RND transporter periplasmic adaptor subunit [Desulfobulbus sp.]